MNLVEQIKLDEGFRQFAYRCPMGKLTVGYGRNIDENGGRGVSESEASLLLGNDLALCDADLCDIFGHEFWATLDAVRRNALTNMRFQLGASGFRGFVNMIAAVKQREWSLACSAALDSRWAAQVPRRAERVAFEICDGIAP